jgi:hypothetical protein
MRRRRSRLKAWGRRGALAGAGLAVLAAAPVVWTEATCRAPREPAAPAFTSALDPADRRVEVTSYLTYPEWAIVHAYEDFAAVARERGESAFGYLAVIRGFWSSLCGVRRLASSRGEIPGEVRVVLYTIGLSFTLEMGAKGLYETTVGRLTAWLRGPERTPEDEFALGVAEDYARFLRQTPWYRYPFFHALTRFWAETPVTGGHVGRKVERRIGLSLEYGAKGVYATLIGLATALDPAPLKIKSVVRCQRAADLAADPRIAVVASRGAGGTVIETPRYRAFTEILLALAARGCDAVEIAGNDDILATVLAPEGHALDLPGVRPLFAVPLQARPGWQRLGLDVRVAALAELIRRMGGSGAEFEHAYDY